MARSWMKARARTEIERALDLCKTSLLLVFVLSFFVNLLALTVPLYLLQVYDHVLSSRSLDTTPSRASAAKWARKSPSFTPSDRS